jgi:hypothetical protein
MKGANPQWAFIPAIEAQGDANWSSQHLTLLIGCEKDFKTLPTLEGLCGNGDSNPWRRKWSRRLFY